MTRQDISATTGTPATAAPATTPGLVTAPLLVADTVLVPLNRLKPAPGNVRRVRDSRSIAALAASIQAHGLLHPPTVEPERDDTGQETGAYLVDAGERRRQALRLLVRQKVLPRHARVPCRLKGSASATATSLAENIAREAMHPADEACAFARLVEEEGRSVAEVALAYGVSGTYVRQRLRLAALAPELLELFRAGELCLAQAEALTLGDQRRQREVWDALGWNRDPDLIRRLLSADRVPASDPRAVLVGLEAYRDAGGSIEEDLFSAVDGVWLADSGLLDRLALARLEAAAAAAVADGWGWAEAHLATPWLHLHRLARLPQAWDEEASYTAEEKARAGVIVHLGPDGTLRAARGLLRDAADIPAAAPPAPDGVPDGDAGTPPTDIGPRPLSERLTQALAAERTAALAWSLATDADAGLAALAEHLAGPVFYGMAGGCLELAASPPDLARPCPHLAETRAGAALAALAARWRARLPADADALPGWIAIQDSCTVRELLAACAALLLDAVPRRLEGPQRLAAADRQARRVGLAMEDWWVPTARHFLDHIPKARILAAITEACGRNEARTVAPARQPGGRPGRRPSRRPRGHPWGHPWGHPRGRPGGRPGGRAGRGRRLIASASKDPSRNPR